MITADSYPARRDSVAEARRRVTDWLRTGGLDEAMLADIAVATSEACTNVVLHAYRNGNGNGKVSYDDELPTFRVTGELEGEKATVTVSDEGGGMIPRPDSPGLGLGMPLMVALSDRVEVGTLPDGSGTVVTLTFTAAGALERGSAH